MNTQKYPWPSREAMDLPSCGCSYLDAPCFEYERESNVLAARDIMLKLWAQALSRLMGATTPDSPASHRALSTMILAKE